MTVYVNICRERKGVRAYSVSVSVAPIKVWNQEVYVLMPEEVV